MWSRLSKTAGGLAIITVLAGCGSSIPTSVVTSPTSQASAAPVSPTTQPSATALPTTTPCTSQSYPLPDLCVGVVGRVPTAGEFAAMVAAGAPTVEKALGYKDWSACSNGENCFKVAPASAAMVGTNAGVFDAGYGQYPSGGLGSPCWVFVYSDSTGWHFLNFGCAQNPGFVPGTADVGSHVYVTGCANFRDKPALSGKVLGCLANGAAINVDSAPVWQDGHMWWHLTGRGWMAHDFLCEVCRV